MSIGRRDTSIRKPSDYEYVKNGALQFLRPGQKLLLFILVAMFSGMLFQLAGAGLANLFFGVNLHDMEVAKDYTSIDVLRSLKLTDLFFQIGTFILPCIVLSKLFTYSPNEFLLFNKPQLNFAYALPVLFIAMIYGNDILSWLNKSVFYSVVPIEWMRDQGMHDKMVYAYIGLTGKSYVINLIVMALVPAIGEELTFRGVMQHLMIKSVRKIHLGITLTALLFAFVHFSPANFLHLFAIGLLYGYLVVITGSIWTSIILHFLNNAFKISMMILIRQGTVDGTHWLVQPNVFTGLTTIVCLGVAILLLKRGHKWHEMKGIYLR